MDRWLRILNGWFRPKLEADENASEQFERLWDDQESGRKVVFMSVVFNTRTSDTDEIEDIGLSPWSKHSLLQHLAYHWRIRDKIETKDVTDFGNPDSFDYGTTQTITKRDIDTVLDDWALNLSSSCDELCIVMYGDQSIKTLGRRWKSPVPITVLDLEAVWRQQHHDAVHSTFEEAISALEGITNVSGTFDHAGNQAYCQVSLLKSLGKEKKKTVLDLEEMDE